MSVPISIQLSIELTKVLPLQKAVNSAGAMILQHARDLKKSGSDIVVEEDFANVFGRNRIDHQLEKLFRERASISSITSLCKDSEIILDACPGPTIKRALKEAVYCSSVIQLSLLAWFHERSSLASSLVKCFHERARMNVPEATADITYEGALRFLEACNAQTSRFPWDLYVGLVEARLEKTAIYHRQTNIPWRRLTSHILVAAMDMLYLTQSLPEDRTMIVQDPTGMLPLIIWAHYVLGLTVLAQDTLDGDVIFAGAQYGGIQVVIHWNKGLQKNNDYSPAWLADKSEQVIIDPLPAGSFSITRITAQERERLGGNDAAGSCGYGMVYLRREFEKHFIISPDHVVYADFAENIIAYAVIVSEALYHPPFGHHEHYAKGKKFLPQCFERLERRRIFDAADIIFRGIDLNKEMIVNQISPMRGIHPKDIAIPASLRALLKEEHRTGWSLSKPAVPGLMIFSMLSNLARHLVILVLAFAHVTNVKSCADIPLVMGLKAITNPGPYNLHTTLGWWKGREPIEIKEDEWLVQLCNMLL